MNVGENRQGLFCEDGLRGAQHSTTVPVVVQSHTPLRTD